MDGPIRDQYCAVVVWTDQSETSIEHDQHLGAGGGEESAVGAQSVAGSVVRAADADIHKPEEQSSAYYHLNTVSAHLPSHSSSCSPMVSLST